MWKFGAAADRIQPHASMPELFLQPLFGCRRFYAPSQLHCRLCVLYEDLRIEIFAMKAESIPPSALRLSRRTKAYSKKGAPSHNALTQVSGDTFMQRLGLCCTQTTVINPRRNELRSADFHGPGLNTDAQA